jgi:polyisoprenoid-binding protein YceI
MPHQGLLRILGYGGTIARLALLCLLASCAMLGASEAQTVPVFAIAPQASSIKFFVSASMSVTGTFDKWDAKLTFASDDPSTGVLDIEIQAASVDTGSGLKDSTLKSDDFFAVDQFPAIWFHSTKVTQTGPSTFVVDGNFQLRGVTRPEQLTLTVSGAGTGSGTIKGTMSFNRTNFGVNGSIPFIRIGDRVDVTVDLKVNRISGPALALKK